MNTTTSKTTNILNAAVSLAWDTRGFEGEPPTLTGEKFTAFIAEKSALPSVFELSEVFGWAHEAWEAFDKCYDQHQEDFPKRRIRMRQADIQLIDEESKEEIAYSGIHVKIHTWEPDAEDIRNFEEDTASMIARWEPDTEDTETEKNFFLVFNPDEILPRERAHSGMLALMEARGLNHSPLQKQRMRRHGVLCTDASEGVEAVHTLWKMVFEKHPEKKFKHPLVPMVQAWLEENLTVAEIERRDSQITPKFLEKSHRTEGASLPTGALHQQGTKTPQLFLPSFETLDDADVVVSALPIEMYQGQKGGGRGAPLDERIFFNALLARPYGKPEPFNAVKLEPTLRDFVNWLYPNGWNRTNQLPLLQKALHAVHNKRITYERRGWNVVQVLAMPTENTQMDDVLPLIIRYPDGVQGNGPLIDVHTMRRYGLVSASKWRAWIRLHYLWDTAKQRNGGYPIYATIPEVKRNNDGYLLDTRGEIIVTGDPYKRKNGRWAVRKGSKPQTVWYHPHAIRTGDTRNPQCGKIPVLMDKHLVALFFDNTPVEKATFRKRLFDAKSAAMDMEADGVILIERDAIDTKKGIRGWRIIPVYFADLHPALPA